MNKATATEGDICPLNELSIGDFARVIDVQGGRKMIRQLMGLGLKTGSEVMVLHRRGQGVVVGSGGNRIAIGESVASSVIMRFLCIAASGEET
ncbi:MAG: ferrous iron transport protein A [Granulosicoccus sp.]